MRILWLSHFVPYPPKGGCFQRSYNLIRQVGTQHDIHLVCLKHKTSTHPEAETRAARSELLRYCSAVDMFDISSATDAYGMFRTAAKSLLTATPFNVTVYRSRAVRDHLKQLCADDTFDVVHFDTIGLAQYLPVVDGRPAVMTHHGAESHMIRRRIPLESNLVRRAFLAFEWLSLRRYERRMCGRFDVNLVMSDDDAQLLREVAADAIYRCVPNGVDTTLFVRVAARERSSIVFAGRLDQYSNRDGMLHFMHEVWPRLATARPNLTIDIIGASPPDALRKFAARDERVRVHGFVPDIRPFFERAAVAICPVRSGGGTRLKVLDALALGVPLVSTSIGCEGIAAVPERHVLIGDSPEQFAAQIGRLLDDAALAGRLATDGRRLIEEKYSWTAIGSELIANYERTVFGPHPAKRAVRAERTLTARAPVEEEGRNRTR